MKIVSVVSCAFVLIGHILLASQFSNGTGTFNCYYRCQSCNDIGPSSCTSCFANYILANGSCVPCGLNCLSCVGATGLCEACASQFYLSQSTWTCNLCPVGSKSCTFSAVQQCLPGYYLVNSICLYCISNCQTCSDAYTCSVCNTGYFLTNQLTCSPCVAPYCSACDQTGLCSLCSSNRFGQTCDLLCPSFCQICDNSICYQCQSGYYLSVIGSCEALSVLCDSGTAPFTCQTCIQDIAFLDSSTCYPYISVHQTNMQIYHQPLNQLTLFSGFLSNCNNFWMIWDHKRVNITLSLQPSYKLRVKIQIMTLINQTQSISLSSNDFKEIFYGNVSSNFGYQCENQSWVLSTFHVNFTPYFQIASTSQTTTLFLESIGSIGVGEVLIEEYLCLIDKCGLCLSAYSCISCLPPYILENNKCLLQCSSGYYFTQQLMICTLSCPSLFFPNLADYSCTPCISPCYSCQSAQECLSCAQGWFLLGNTCYTNCPFGYYERSDTQSCAACQYPCSTCSGSEVNCTSCSLGFLYQTTGTCMMSCPGGLFSNFTTITCNYCSLQCSSCQFSNNHCTSCSSPLFLNQNGTCLTSCDATYAANSQTNSCQKCEYPCRTCNSSSTICLTCFAGYLQSNNCVSVCSVGTYSDFQFKQCLSCPKNCLSCVSKLQCTSCSDGYYYSPSLQTCFSSCPNTSFPDVNFTCTLCRSPCSTCLNRTYCLSCQGYLFVYTSGMCLLSCPVGTFVLLDQTTNLKFCSSCGVNCSVCISATLCITCNGTWLYQGSCVNSCPVATYEWNGVCSNCSFPCLNCSASNICLSCRSSYYYYSPSNSCLKICPSGFYASSQLCLPCSPICALCNDPTINCLTCALGYFKNSNGSCLSTCGPGQYPYTIQNVCKKCSSPCLQCLSANLCSSCDNSSVYPYIFSHSCVASCPNGYFANSNYTCQQCSSSCLYCAKTYDNCTQCDGNHYFLSNTTNQCVPDCPQRYYPNSAAFCTPCLPPCELCVSQSICISCSSSSYYFQDGNCLSTCSFGYYSSIQNGSNVCGPCDLNCLECNGNTKNCTRCASGLFLTLSQNSSNRQCTISCPGFFYPDVVNQICSACLSPCVLCYSSSRCVSCVQGFYLQFDLCLENCMDGYYSSGKLCIHCEAPCATCLSNSSCLSCIANYYLEQNQTKCLNQCPSSTYPFQTSNGDLQCLSCPTSCLQCFDSVSCRSCQSSSFLPYLQGTTCQATCTDGYYALNGSTVCEWCGWGCLSCDSLGICTQCSNSYLYGGVCQTQCPVGYYGSVSFTCEACISPCFDCYNAANCEFCISGYFLYLTHCLSFCPTNQWAILSLNICNQTCSAPYFKIPQNRTCVSACSAYYDSQGNCVDICPRQFMANQSLGCESCETADCSQKLYFQLIYYQQNGKLFLLMAFNLPIDNLNYFASDSVTVTLNPAISIDPIQLQLSALRTLQEVLTVNANSVSIVDKKTYYITLQLNLQDSGSTFSGILDLTVKDLSSLTVGGYPLQIQNATVTLPEYQTNSGGGFALYLGEFVSGVLLLVFLISFVCGNQRSVLLAVDGLQTIHVLFYLSVWNHPLLQNYMLGLRFTALRSLVSNFGGVQSLWNCTPKYIILYGSCNFYLELILPALIVFTLLLLAFVCKFITFFEGKHKIIWSHAHSIWWIAGLSIGVSSFRAVSESAAATLPAGVVISALFIIFSLILGFKIIENVYSNSFSESCFFWDLKKKKAQHQLSNLHWLLLLVRRIIIVIAVSVGYQNPLSSLFVVTLLTICVISNIIINKPFKKYGIVVGTAESLFGLILVLLQMYIVNTSRLSNAVWNGLGYTIFMLVVAYTLLLLALAIKETIQHAQKVYRKCPCKHPQSHGEPHQQSHHEQEPERDLHSQQDERERENAVFDETQHHLVKASMGLSPKESQSSHIFSQSGDLERSGAAPKLLLKIEKQSLPSHSLKKVESE